jgi:hypothetical protein
MTSWSDVAVVAGIAAVIGLAIYAGKSLMQWWNSAWGGHPPHSWTELGSDLTLGAEYWGSQAAQAGMETNAGAVNTAVSQIFGSSAPQWQAPQESQFDYAKKFYGWLGSQIGKDITNAWDTAAKDVSSGVSTLEKDISSWFHL